MAITSIPGNRPLDEPVRCVICGCEAPLADLTAGLVDATGKQQFACFGHSWDGSKFIVGWAAFVSKQRRVLAEAAQQMEYGEGMRHGQRIR
jgi:hypothetical protein